MIESPVLQALLARREKEAGRKAVIRFLTARFGTLPDDLAAEIRTIQEEGRLEALMDSAARCPDLNAFRACLRS